MYTLANLGIGDTDPSFQALEIERQTVVVDTALKISGQKIGLCIVQSRDRVSYRLESDVAMV